MMHTVTFDSQFQLQPGETPNSFCQQLAQQPASLFAFYKQALADQKWQASNPYLFERLTQTVDAHYAHMTLREAIQIAKGGMTCLPADSPLQKTVTLKFSFKQQLTCNRLILSAGSRTLGEMLHGNSFAEAKDAIKLGLPYEQFTCLKEYFETGDFEAFKDISTVQVIQLAQFFEVNDLAWDLLSANAQGRRTLSREQVDEIRFLLGDIKPILNSTNIDYYLIAALHADHPKIKEMAHTILKSLQNYFPGVVLSMPSDGHKIVLEIYSATADLAALSPFLKKAVESGVGLLVRLPAALLSEEQNDFEALGQALAFMTELEATEEPCEGLKKLFPHCKTLQKVAIFNQAGMIKTIAQHCTQLETCHLVAGTIVASAADLTVLSSECRSLKVLRLQYCTFEPDNAVQVTHFQLRELVIEGCYSICEAQVLDLLSPSLERFELFYQEEDAFSVDFVSMPEGYPSALRLYGLQKLKETCPHLTALKLSRFMTRFSLEDLQDFLSMHNEWKEIIIENPNACYAFNERVKRTEDVSQLIEAMYGFQKLEKVRLSGNNPELFETLPVHWPKLKQFNFSEPREFGSSRLALSLPSLIEHNPTLESLSLPKNTTPQNLADFRYLTRLVVPHVNDESLKTFIADCVSLQSIHLSKTYSDFEVMGITDQSIEEIAEQCPSVESLELAHCKALTDNCLSALKRMPKLRVLDLRGTQLSEDKCKELFTHCMYLEKILITKNSEEHVLYN